jgi:hypothetical protein
VKQIRQRHFLGSNFKHGARKESENTDVSGKVFLLAENDLIRVQLCRKIGDEAIEDGLVGGLASEQARKTPSQ